MAIRWAVSNGVWSNVNIWNDGNTLGLPSFDDDVFSNNRTVLIDFNLSAASFRNRSLASPTIANGGTFIINDNVSVSGNIEGFTFSGGGGAGPVSTACVQFISGNQGSFFGTVSANTTSSRGVVAFLHRSGGRFSFYGQGLGAVYSADDQGSYGYVENNSGTLYISGYFRGNFPPTSRSAWAIISHEGKLIYEGAIYGSDSSVGGGNAGQGGIAIRGGDFDFNGSILPGLNGFSQGVIVLGQTGIVVPPVMTARTVNMTAFSSGTNQQFCINNLCNNTNTINIVGDFNQPIIGTTNLAIVNNGTATIYFSGSTYGSLIRNNNAAGTIITHGSIEPHSGGGLQQSIAGGTMIHYGSISGSSTTANIPGASQSVTGNIIINGPVYGFLGQGVSNTGSGTVYIKQVYGPPGGPTNPLGGTAVGLSNSQNGLVFVEEVYFGAQGATPISGPVFMVSSPTNKTSLRTPFPNFSEVTLFGSPQIEGLFPPASSVRLGIVYGNGDFTGTMAVPSPSAVQFDVPVDDTRGLLFIRPESFWDIPRSSPELQPGSIGYRLRNVATIPAAGQLIGSFNVDPISGYNAPI